MAAKKKGTLGKGAFTKYANLIINPREVAKQFGYISTGSPRVDNMLGGGLTKGRISEFYGREQSGKSTLALSTARGVIKEGGRVLWIDLERGLEVREPGMGSWLEKNGINAFDGSFDIIQSGQEAIAGEDIYNIMIASVRDAAHQYIVLDSMAAVTTRAELAGEIGDATFGGVAKLNSSALKTLFALQGTNPNTHISILNQVRDQLQGGMGGLKSTGGRALPHYVHQKIRFDKLGRAKQQSDGDFLTPIRVRLEKARGSAASEVEITISANRGIDVLTEVFEAAVEANYVIKAGSWNYLFDRPIDADTDMDDPKTAEGFIKASQGESGVKEALANHTKLYDELYEVAVGSATVAIVDGEEDGE